MNLDVQFRVLADVALAIGMAVAVHLYVLAAAVTVLVLLVLRGLTVFEFWLARRRDQ